MEARSRRGVAWIPNLFSVVGAISTPIFASKYGSSRRGGRPDTLAGAAPVLLDDARLEGHGLLEASLVVKTGWQIRIWLNLSFELI